MFQIGSSSHSPITLHVRINGVHVPMELDTGAAVSVISRSTKQKYLPNVPLLSTCVVLRTYTNEKLPVTGEMKVHLVYEDQQKTVTLYVLDGESPSIFGCDWLSVIKLNWRFIKWTTTSKGDPDIEAVLSKFSEVFKDELGTIKNYSAKLQVRDYTTPYFCRPCPVRFSLKPKLDAELDWLVEKGILKEVSHSAWASPVVTVSKKDGRVRLCGDYKVSVNRSLHVDQHPLPTPEELFSALTGGQQFSTLDLS